MAEINMRVKILMQWDIDDSKESDYYDFIVNEFIPRLQRLGLTDIQFWYTTFGKCEQIQASGVANDLEQANVILESDEWDDLNFQLVEMVENYSQKLIKATGGFQL